MNDPSGKRFSQLGRTPRSPGLPGKGYTTFVRVMRLALPLVAIGIIGLLLSWPRVEETMAPIPKEAVVPKAVGKNELVNPRFESVDNKEQPFSITAQRAVQSARDPSVVLLEAPVADITLTNGTWLAAQAERGAYRQNADRLLLQGKVRLYHDEGYEMTTDKLLVNLKSREAWSDEPVFGQGPAGTLQASGLQAHAGDQQLVFTGPVKLVLNRKVEGLQ